MEVYKKEASELEEQLLILRKQRRPEEILQKASRLLEIAQLHRIPTTLQLHCIFRHIMNFQEEITKNVFSTAFKVRNTVKKMNI